MIPPKYEPVTKWLSVAKLSKLLGVDPFTIYERSDTDVTIDNGLIESRETSQGCYEFRMRKELPDRPVFLEISYVYAPYFTWHKK